MTYRNIMVPFDGSESAMNALTEAKSLAQIDTSSMLHVVNVAPIPESQMLMMVDPNAPVYDVYGRMVANTVREIAGKKLPRGIYVVKGIKFNVK